MMLHFLVEVVNLASGALLSTLTSRAVAKIHLINLSISFPSHGGTYRYNAVLFLIHESLCRLVYGHGDPC